MQLQISLVHIDPVHNAIYQKEFMLVTIFVYLSTWSKLYYNRL